MMKQIGMDDLLPFGKYMGEQVEDVLTDHPHYLKWMSERTDIDFDDEVLERLEYV